MATASMKETTSVKLDKEVKEEAKKIFKQLGISMGDAFNMFLHQVSRQQGMPFELKLPNKETAKAIKEACEGKNVENFGPLRTGTPLPAESKDHSLEGNYADCREFHLDGDVLVIYLVNDNNEVILLRLGTHSQLFK